MRGRKSIVSLLLLVGPFVLVILAQGQPEDARGTGNSGETNKSNEDPDSIDEFLPKSGSLFEKDALDPEGLSQIDCHLRNVDYCFAGLLGGMQKLLPETDSELEVRCDEVKVAMGCIAIFNKRCDSFRVFASFNPMSTYEQLLSGKSDMLPPEMTDLEIPPELTGVLMNKNASGEVRNLKTMDLLQLCDPASKKTKMNQFLRKRLFELGSCANSRVHLLNPCLDDLKTALQVFYEPGRSLPLKPSCCAISRFRECARGALDKICGLSSWTELEKMLTSSSLGSQSLKIVNRICRQEANKFNSPYCIEVLPPVGMKAPPARRGSKASKLAKALDLISLSQPPTASFV